MPATGRSVAFGPLSYPVDHERAGESALAQETAPANNMAARRLAAPVMPPLLPPIAPMANARTEPAFVPMAPAPAPANIVAHAAAPGTPAPNVVYVQAPTPRTDRAEQPVTLRAPGASWRSGLGRFSGQRSRRGPASRGADLLAPQAAPTRVEDMGRPFRRPMTVLVANPKGGSGKTPLTLMLAGTLALMRGGHLVAWDNHESRGGLAQRASSRGVAGPGEAGSTVRDLLTDLSMFESHAAGMGELGAYLRPQDELFDVLAADDDPTSLGQIGTADFERLHAVLRRYYRILILDSGSDVRSPAWQAAAAVADCLVLASTYDADSVAAADWTLDHLVSIGRGDLVERAVTVLTAAHGRPEPNAQTEARTRFARTAAVLEIAHDPKLRAGNRIARATLSESTIGAVALAARAVVEQLCLVDGPAAAAAAPEKAAVPPRPRAAVAEIAPVDEARAKAPTAKVVAAKVATAKGPSATVSTRRAPAPRRTSAPKVSESATKPKRTSRAARPEDAVASGEVTANQTTEVVVTPCTAQEPPSTRRIAKPRTGASVADTPLVAETPATGAATSGAVDSNGVPLLFVATASLDRLSTPRRRS